MCLSDLATLRFAPVATAPPNSRLNTRGPDGSRVDERHSSEFPRTAHHNLLLFDTQTRTVHGNMRITVYVSGAHRTAGIAYRGAFVCGGGGGIVV